MTIIRAVSRVYPAVTVGGCVEPYMTGANVLRDPGVEDYLSITGGGPEGDRLPQFTFTTPGGLVWSDSSDAPTSTPFAGNAAVARDARISTVDPDAGAYHIEITRDGGGTPNLYLLGLTACSPGVGEWGGLPVTARANPGDTVTINWRAKGVGTTEEDTTRGFVAWIASDYISFDGGSGPQEALSTAGYQSYQWSTVAPAGTFLCLAGITTSYGEGDGVRYDTFSVVVS